MSVRAWKFLGTGARSPVTDEPWASGEWRERENGAAGVHVLGAGDLAWWLAPELWEVEAEPGPATTDGFRAPRARLVARVARWDADAEAALVADVRARALATLERGAPERTRKLVTDLETIDEVRVATYVAAMAFASTAQDPGEQRARFAAERAAQSRFVARRAGIA